MSKKRTSKQTPEQVGVKVTRDCLLVVGYDVPLSLLRALRGSELTKLVNYAGKLHFAASDNLDVKVPKCPDWLDKFEDKTPPMVEMKKVDNDKVRTLDIALLGPTEFNHTMIRKVSDVLRAKYDLDLSDPHDDGFCEIMRPAIIRVPDDIVLNVKISYIGVFEGEDIVNIVIAYRSGNIILNAMVQCNILIIASIIATSTSYSRHFCFKTFGLD